MSQQLTQRISLDSINGNINEFLGQKHEYLLYCLKNELIKNKDFKDLPLLLYKNSNWNLMYLIRIINLIPEYASFNVEKQYEELQKYPLKKIANITRIYDIFTDEDLIYELEDVLSGWMEQKSSFEDDFIRKCKNYDNTQNTEIRTT